MAKINLHDIELFKPLLDVDFQGNNLDIHNDYEVKNILYRSKNLQLLLVNNLSDNKILLNFHNAEIIEFDIPSIDNLTIDNFYRGRYEYENELFDEFDNKKCFYIEFSETGQINVLCSELTLSEL